MITQLNLEGETRIVKERDIAHLSASGWKLVAMIVVSEAIPLHAVNEHGQPIQSRWNEPPPKIETVLGTAFRGVMVRDKDDTLRERNERIEHLCQKEQDLQDAQKRLQSELEVAQKMIAEKEAARAHLSGIANAREQALAEGRERVRKMESDLGKIREELGAKRMKEILEC